MSDHVAETPQWRQSAFAGSSQPMPDPYEEGRRIRGVKVRHRTLTRDEWLDVYLKQCKEMYDHLVDSHGLEPKVAAHAVLDDFAKMARRGLGAAAVVGAGSEERAAQA